jgi:hypothetical protein
MCQIRDHCPFMCCWDETDDGVMPLCHTNPEYDEPPVPWWKVFNEENEYTNDNAMCWLFGTNDTSTTHTNTTTTTTTHYYYRFTTGGGRMRQLPC